MFNCHSAGLVATILHTGVDLLVVLWVSVAFCVSEGALSRRKRIPDSAILRLVPWVSADFGCVLRIDNSSLDLVAIKALSIVTVLVLLLFLL